MVHWILQEMSHQYDFNVVQKLVYMLPELGHKVTTFKYTPFGGTDWGFLPEQGPCVYYGGCNALADIRERNITVPRPFAWYDSDSMKCSTYYREYRGLIAQKEPEFLSLGQLSEESFADHKTLFVRPDDNEKSFVGQLVDKDMLGAFITQVKGYGDIDETCQVVTALPQKIHNEWRLFVVNGKVITGSQYKDRCCIEIVAGYPDEVCEFAEYVAAIWAPFPIFVIDVCLTDDGYKVMEIGPFNYAGVYLSDLRKLVVAINNYVEGGTQ